VLTRIPVSMNATACYFVNGMESETSAIARGLRRRDPDLLDRLIEQYRCRFRPHMDALRVGLPHSLRKAHSMFGEVENTK